MRKEQCSLSRLFVIPVILSLVAVSSFACTIQTQISGATPENILSAAQSNLDRSLSILNTVASLMEGLVGLLALILTAAAGVLGFLGYKQWKDIKGPAVRAKNAAKEAEKAAAEAKQASEKAKQAAEQGIESFFKKLREAEKEAETIRKSMGEILPFGQALSEETKRKLEELGKKVEFLENFGVQPKFEDYLARATKFYYDGKYELALEAYGKAIELKPDLAVAWSNKGVALRNLGRYEEALKAYDKAIELKPDYADAWNNKGAALGEVGRHEEALKAYDKAIELKPDLATAWSNKGVALDELGRHEEALKAYDRAIELEPDYADAWYNRACTYSLKGDKENALKNLSRAIALDAKFKEEAKKDEDFRNLWDAPDFKKLTG